MKLTNNNMILYVAYFLSFLVLKNFFILLLRGQGFKSNIFKIYPTKVALSVKIFDFISNLSSTFPQLLEILIECQPKELPQSAIQTVVFTFPRIRVLHDLHDLVNRVFISLPPSTPFLPKTLLHLNA